MSGLLVIPTPFIISSYSNWVTFNSGFTNAFFMWASLLVCFLMPLAQCEVQPYGTGFISHTSHGTLAPIVRNFSFHVNGHFVNLSFHFTSRCFPIGILGIPNPWTFDNFQRYGKNCVTNPNVPFLKFSCVQIGFLGNRPPPSPLTITC